MNLRRAGKGIVRKGKRPSVYRIGFNDGDETELTANGINELEELWRSLCPEFECEPDSVNYVERVGYEEEDWFEIKKNDAKRIVKRMGWESLADFLNNYTWDDTEILYQIADNCGMIVADWIEREVEDGRN